MARLLIQFLDQELTDFHWAVCDETAESGELDWQPAAADELAVIAVQHPHPLIFVIPQQCVYLTQLELPQKVGRQVLAAIEFQVEDQLAQDIESQHFALGNTSTNPISIAVVTRAIMERCMTLAHSHGLRLVQILPELFLCPWQGESVALIEGCDGYLLRYGDYRGLKCHAEVLPAMLEMVKRDVIFDEIVYYQRAADPMPELEGYRLERRTLAATRPGFLDAPIINLQQRDYQLSSAWRSLAKAWRWVGILFAVLLLVGAYNKAMALQELETRLAEVRQQQYELVKPHLPADTTVDANLKKLLIERLKKIQEGQREQGFMKLLLDFTKAQKQFPEVKVSRISYQGTRLGFDVSSTKLNDIEALLEAISKMGINVKLESLSIRPEESSGRLVLQGGDDV
jgi:general secretion pathway protein L